MKHYKIELLVLLAVLSFGCGGGGDDELPPVPPTATTLIFPLQNSECTEGSAQTDTKSTISFKWNASANTDSYEVVVKNLNSSISNSYATNTTTKDIVLDRAVPYSWKVISKSVSVSQTATSPTWKFYNAGEGLKTYPPFPAEIIEPSMGEYITSTNNTVSLKWKGTSVSNNIVSYDVYFGTANPPSLHKANHTSVELTGVVVTVNTIYYWKIVTKDAKGNSSDSGIYNFKIN